MIVQLIFYIQNIKYINYLHIFLHIFFAYKISHTQNAYNDTKLAILFILQFLVSYKKLKFRVLWLLPSLKLRYLFKKIMQFTICNYIF